MKIVRPINTKGKSPNISNGYHSGHNAVDYAYTEGTNVHCATDGVIKSSINLYNNSWNSTPPLAMKDYGNRIDIDHGNGWLTRYAHLKKDSLMYQEGEEVKMGQKIAEVGNTGNSTGPHLHFELVYRGKRVQPSKYMDFDYNAYFVNPVEDIGKDWETILKKQLPDEAWEMLNEFEILEEKGLIKREDSIQTQTQKVLNFYNNTYKNLESRYKTYKDLSEKYEDKINNLNRNINNLENDKIELENDIKELSNNPGFDKTKFVSVDKYNKVMERNKRLKQQLETAKKNLVIKLNVEKIKQIIQKFINKITIQK